jgi:glycosyltransferase involved in cell wall biosynthesis
MSSPDPRLRVAYVYRHFNLSGSIPSVFYRSASRLAEDEDVTVFCSAATREPSDAPLSFESVEPLISGRGRFRYALECGRFAVRAGARLRRERERFDVIHAEGFSTLAADLVSVHAVRPAEAAHYFENIEPRARVRRRLTPILRPQTGVVLAIERRLFAPPFPVCRALSAAVAADLERHYGVPEELVEVIPYGIDVDAFRAVPGERERVRAELGVDPDRLVLLLVGDDFERKGLASAIGALAEARGDAELWVAGRGRPEPFARAAGSLGVSDRVRFLGRLDRVTLASTYAAADVLVLPSRQDAWGHPVIEAMAAGCVVLVSEFAGAHEIVTPGETGFVLEGAGAPAQIASLIDGPLASAEGRSRIGRASLDVAATFDEEPVYRRLRALHHRAAARRRALQPRSVALAPF